MLSAKQGRKWYHFYNTFGVTWSGTQPTTSRSHGKRSTTEPPLRLLPVKLVDGVVVHVHLHAVSPIVFHVRHVDQRLTDRRLDEETMTCGNMSIDRPWV